MKEQYKKDENVSTYDDVINYLSEADGCSSSCIFSYKCPAYNSGKLLNTCLVKRDNMYDVFFNLFFDTKKGLDMEIKNALYTMAKDAVTTGDKKDYLANLVKVKTAFYGPDKDKEVEEITNVNIDIVPVGPNSQQSTVEGSEQNGQKRRGRPKKEKNGE